MKQYIGISRDHSASMEPLRQPAMRDYNEMIASIRDAASVNSIDTVVSVVKCGHGTRAIVARDIVNSSVHALQPLERYEADAGGTPLWDSVGELIDIFSTLPDANDPNVAFLVTVITDGEENRSYKWTAMRLINRMRELQATDRWTFVFRVPRGYGRTLAKFGVPEGNILEWEQTAKGLEKTSTETQTALRSYFDGRSRGINSTQTFYTSLKDVSQAEIKAVMTDISKEVSIWTVPDDENDEQIKPFCEKRLNRDMLKGAAFYQLTKKENAVQDYKCICVRDKNTKAVYGGDAARDILGLPKYGTVKLAPGNHGDWDIFIQSTSVNRKLKAGTDLLYWPKAPL